jgi:phage-related protein
MASSQSVSLDKVVVDIEANIGDASGKIDSLAASLLTLKNNISGGFNNLKKLSESIKNINDAAEKLPNTVKNLGNMNGVALSLQRLTQISTPSGLNSLIKSLEKMPKVFNDISTTTIHNVGRVSSELAKALEPLASKMLTIGNGFTALSTMAKQYGIAVTKVGSSTKNASNNMADMSRKTKKLSDTLGDGSKYALDQISKLRTGLTKLSSKVKQIGLSLLGTRSIFTATRKAISEYMGMDKQLSDGFQNIWRAIGAQLAPALEYILHLFTQFARVIYSLILALTGVDLISRANAKAFATMNKSASKALGNLQKFDDLNVVDFGKGASEVPQIELEPIDLTPLKPLLEWLKQLKQAFKDAFATGDVQPIFDVLTQGVRKLVDAFKEIDGKTLGQNISKLLIGLVTGIWQFLRDLPFGEIAVKINEIIKEIDWGELFTKLLAGWLAWIGAKAQLFYGILFGKEFQDKGIAAVWGIIGILAVNLLKLFGTGLLNKLLGGNALADGVGSLAKSAGSALQIIAILGGLALAITAVTNLFKVLSETGTSVSDVIDLLLVMFVGLAGVMALIVLLGPSMTAGLGPFAIVIGLILATLATLALTLPPILDACGKFIDTIAPHLTNMLEIIGDLILNILYILGTTLPPIIRAVGDYFTSIFNGIAKIIRTVGDVIVNIMNTACRSVEKVLNAIIKFIRELGPAIESFVDSTIRSVTKLINFIVSGVEFAINSIINAINGLSSGLRKIGNKLFELIGVDVTFNAISKVKLERFAPKLATGTNEIPYEGLYHLHEGEAVVPKKYNPALGNGTDEELGQKLDTLINIMNNMNFTNVVNLGNETLYKKQQKYNQMQNDKYGTTVSL